MSTHHGPPCGHTIPGTCTGCGWRSSHTWAVTGERPVDTDRVWHREYLGEWVKPDVSPDSSSDIDRWGATSTTCARCSHAFTGTPDDETLYAHQERCFVVGDWVRWEPKLCPLAGGWAEGVVERTGPVVINVSACSGMVHVGPSVRIDPSMEPSELRRIPRPEPSAVWKCVEANGNLSGLVGFTPASTPSPYATNADVAAHLNGLGWQVAWNDEPTPAPMLYDGLTAEQCLERWQLRQREEGAMPFSGQVRYPTRKTVLTASQLAAARELWSSQLRASIAASKERELTRVVVELQDVES